MIEPVKVTFRPAIQVPTGPMTYLEGLYNGRTGMLLVESRKSGVPPVDFAVHVPTRCVIEPLTGQTFAQMKEAMGFGRGK